MTQTEAIQLAIILLGLAQLCHLLSHYAKEKKK